MVIKQIIFLEKWTSNGKEKDLTSRVFWQSGGVKWLCFATAPCHPSLILKIRASWLPLCVMAVFFAVLYIKSPPSMDNCLLYIFDRWLTTCSYAMWGWKCFETLVYIVIKKKTASKKTRWLWQNIPSSLLSVHYICCFVLTVNKSVQ